MFVSGDPLRSPGPRGEQQVDASFLLWLNAGRAHVPITLPENDWVQAGEVVLSTDPKLPMGTPVKAGDRLSSPHRSSSATDPRPRRAVTERGDQSRVAPRVAAIGPRAVATACKPAIGASVVTARAEPRGSAQASATTPSSATEVSSSLRGMTRTV